MTVAGFEGVEARGDTNFRRGLVDAEAEAGYFEGGGGGGRGGRYREGGLYVQGGR